MENAREEFVAEIRGLEVECAVIKAENNGKVVNLVLKRGYTSKDYEEFLNELDFEYYSGYGRQMLFGTIWFTNGFWAERVEYDGSEWWEVRYRPDIPQECER